MSKKTWNDFILEKSNTYDKWLQRYKGKSVHDLTVNEHTKYSGEYKAWKAGNIEKMT